MFAQITCAPVPENSVTIIEKTILFYAGKMAKKVNKQIPPNALPANAKGDGRTWLSMNRKLAILLGLVAFVVYANTLNNGYVLDDINMIRDNQLVRGGVQAIPQILSTPYRYGWGHLDNDLYRPLSVVTFAIEYQLFGLDPKSGHFVNIVWFAGCVVLLFLFLERLFGGKRTAVAFMAALLFALHPIHTEVVANIKSRDELLCFFFGFLSLLVLKDYMDTGKVVKLLLGSFCFLLALLAKETVITFLVILPLVFFFYANGNKKRAVYVTLSAVLVSALFLIVRFSVLKAYHSDHLADNDMIENALANTGLSYSSRIATAVLILGYYIKLLFVPYPLICDYSYNSIPYAHFTDVGVLISLAVYVLLIVFSIRRLFKNEKDPYAFGGLFFLVSISLFSNIPFLIGCTMAERFTFFPSVGFCLIAALCIEQWVWRKEGSGMAVLKDGKVRGVMISIAIIYSLITINRNTDWADEYTLYKTDLAKAPNDARLNYYLGDEMLTAMLDVKDPVQHTQMAEEVVGYLSRAIAIYPGYRKAHYDIGNAYWVLLRYDSAEYHYKQAEQQGFGGVRLLRNMAHMYFDWKKYRQSAEYDKLAIGADPGNVIFYANAGLCYRNLGQYDSAIYYSKKAVSVDPAFAPSYKVLSASYKAAGMPDSAAKYEAIAGQSQQ